MYGYWIYDYHQTSTSVPQCYAVCSGQYTTGGPFRFTKTSQFEFTRCLLSFSQPFSSTGLRFDCLTSFSFALRVHLDPSALAAFSSFAQRLPQLLPFLRWDSFALPCEFCLLRAPLSRPHQSTFGVSLPASTFFALFLLFQLTFRQDCPLDVGVHLLGFTFILVCGSLYRLCLLS